MFLVLVTKSMFLSQVICPTSLVKNWANEITKWLGDRLQGGVIALSECSREDVIDGINKFCMRG